MSHWSDSFLNYQKKEDYNCADFVSEVAFKLYGVRIKIPSQLGKISNENHIRNAISSGLGYLISDPLDGHPVLLRMDGTPSHLGIMSYKNGEWSVVHFKKRLGIVAEPLNRFKNSFYNFIEGFYKWNF